MYIPVDGALDLGEVGGLERLLDRLAGAAITTTTTTTSIITTTITAIEGAYVFVAGEAQV